MDQVSLVFRTAPASGDASGCDSYSATMAFAMARSTSVSSRTGCRSTQALWTSTGTPIQPSVVPEAYPEHDGVAKAGTDG